MDKPQKPTDLLPSSFGGQKEAFSDDKIANGYQPDVPDILGGANLNYTLDTIGKELEYTETIADFVNGLPADHVISTDKNNKLIYKSIDEFGTFGLPPGTLIQTFCSSTFTPNNCLPCNGSQYTQAQFASFYNNYLVGGRLLTCTYTEYASEISTYGKCAKFAVDATVGTFKTPYIPDGTVIQNAMTDTELGKAYNAGLPAINISATTNSTGAHTHSRGTMNITGTFGAESQTSAGPVSGAFSASQTTAGVHNGTTGAYQNTYTFDASKTWTGATSSNGAHTHNVTIKNNSSSIFGKSNTVQTNSVALRHFVVVGSGTINDADMDWSAWATGLNTKVSKSGDTMTGGLTISQNAGTQFLAMDISNMLGSSEENIGDIAYKIDGTPIGLVRATRSTEGVNKISFVIRQDGVNKSELGISCDSAGNSYTTAPTPSVSDNSQRIATTKWARQAGIGKPGTVAVNISTPSAGTSFTAPANGFIYKMFNAEAGSYVAIIHSTHQVVQRSYAQQNVTILSPVYRGEQVTINWNGTFSTDMSAFVFVYDKNEN